MFIPKVYKTYIFDVASKNSYKPVCGYLSSEFTLTIPNDLDFMTKYNFTSAKMKNALDSLVTVSNIAIDMGQLCIETEFIDKYSTIIFTDDIIKVNFTSNSTHNNSKNQERDYWLLGRVCIEDGCVIVKYLSKPDSHINYLSNIKKENCEVIGNKLDVAFWLKILTQQIKWQGISLDKYNIIYDISLDKNNTCGSVLSELTISATNNFRYIIDEYIMPPILKECDDILLTIDEKIQIKTELTKLFNYNILSQSEFKFGETETGSKTLDDLAFPVLLFGFDYQFTHSDILYTINVRVQA